jgi:hypothetical protein
MELHSQFVTAVNPVMDRANIKESLEFISFRENPRASTHTWVSLPKYLFFDPDRGNMVLLSLKRPPQGDLCKEADIPSVGVPCAFLYRYP